MPVLAIGITNDNIIDYESQDGSGRLMTRPVHDLLLHPVRLRIVQSLMNRPMTATEVKERLGDVAQATLYRHINQLEAGGLIEIVDERQVRGGVERTFRVVEGAASLGESDLAGVSPDDHLRFFVTFVGTLLADYAAYVESGEPDLVADRVGYQQVALWLTDEEFDEMTDELRAVVHARLDHEPGPRRRRRLVTSIVMPDERRGSG